MKIKGKIRVSYRKVYRIMTKLLIQHLIHDNHCYKSLLISIRWVCFYWRKSIDKRTGFMHNLDCQK